LATGLAAGFGAGLAGAFLATGLAAPALTGAFLVAGDFLAAGGFFTGAFLAAAAAEPAVFLDGTALLAGGLLTGFSSMRLYTRSRRRRGARKREFRARGL
jgi:hypothetical protein